ncbi:MAG: 4-(cytidine 5'-diphospho)-2-C-methyl-D-erythritol kinase [Alphaproteobacteria bacterium]|nr:4-(cytidine 5'-diphospho)-2-C-methyl-D-erythritol kinase [Alphaproteobacteria bacterium]
MREAAPAKINLYLHVAGRRSDGLHLLDSLVVFAALGDVVTVSPGAVISLTRSGPQAGALPPVEDDLVHRAAHMLADRAGAAAGAAIHVEKNLPIASGIGGGSADAAAAIRALARLWEIELPPALLASLAEDLGADVTVCLVSQPALVSGIGETLSSPGPLPPLHAVLVNPRVAVPTAEVFAAFAAGPPALPADPNPIDAWSSDPATFIGQLARHRNDLTDAALSLCPVIGDVLAGLGAQPECQLARMSGSGATCFGLFTTPAAAQAAADAIGRDKPNWWVAATGLETATG